MNDTTPQLTTDELAIATGEPEVVPEIEPEADVSETAGETELVPPDIEPSATGAETGSSIAVEEEGELQAPEFTPVEAGILDVDEEDWIKPEETPPYD